MDRNVGGGRNKKHSGTEPCLNHMNSDMILIQEPSGVTLPLVKKHDSIYFNLNRIRMQVSTNLTFSIVTLKIKQLL